MSLIGGGSTLAQLTECHLTRDQAVQIPTVVQCCVLKQDTLSSFVVPFQPPKNVHEILKLIASAQMPLKMPKLNKKISVFRVTGQKILGRVGTHFFSEKNI